MRMRLLTALMAGVASAALVVATPASATTTTGTGTGLHPRPVTTFTEYDDFAESAVVAPDGSLYVSVTTWDWVGDTGNTGQVWRVWPDGHRARFGPTLTMGVYGMLTGVTLDSAGRVFVAVVDEGDVTGVYRVTSGAWTQKVVLPDGFPNDLIVSDGMLYVSDSLAGSVWRWPIGGPAPTTPWLVSGLLAPSGTGSGLGANGLAVRGGTLYVAVADARPTAEGDPTGSIVTVPIRANGSPGKPTVLVRRTALATIDAIAFDPDGRLWLTTNGFFTTDDGGMTYTGSGQSVQVLASGHLTTLARDTAWLNYPTDVVFAETGCGTTVYLVNGALYGGRPAAGVLTAHLPF